MVRLAYGTNVCDSVWFYFRFVPIELIQIKWKTFIHEQALASMEGQMNWILVHKTTSHHLNEKLTSVNTTETETHTQRERERLCVFFIFFHFVLLFSLTFLLLSLFILHFENNCPSYIVLKVWILSVPLTPTLSCSIRILRQKNCALIFISRTKWKRAGGLKSILELVKTQRANFNRPTNLSTHSSNGQQGKRERQIQLK